MLVALLVATLCSLMTASVVLISQGLVAARRDQNMARRRLATDLIKRTGTTTPQLLAEGLGLSELDANRLLRSMVDDVHFTMTVDDEQGVLRFYYIGS